MPLATFSLLMGNMSTYLLLRNNKQSGPFNLDEIRAMGVKAYDLVWVEGKSAAWRYPCEIEEFKSFAPVVEEQPFDRFFKKVPATNQSANNKPASVLKQTVPASNESLYQSPAAGNSIPNQPAANIYASLPSEEREIVFSDQSRKENEKNQAATQDNRIWDAKYREQLQKTYTRTQSLPQYEPATVVLEEKFSQPLDDIKKQYVENVLNRKKNSVQIFHFFKPVAIAFGIIILFGTGLFMGLAINKRGNITPKDNLKEENLASGQQTVYRAHPFPESSVPEQRTDKAIDENFLQEPSLVPDKKEIRAAEKKKMKSGRERASGLVTVSANKPVTDSNNSSPVTDQRQSVHRTDAVVARDAVKNNISEYVFLTSNKYNVGAFGGISDLQITVSNRSLYPIDLVMVEVQYIQSNKKIFKTENIYYHNIRAGSALMQEAPKSPRGIKVVYRIAIINSKELGLAYSGM
jgi:hypothetical protein